jgi:transposase
MSKTRKRRTNFTAEQKIRILREHLLEDVPISDVCDRHGLRPGQFYLWQKQLFEHGAQVFHRTPDRQERELKKKLQKLQDQTREKDEVIAEVTRELVFLKKADGGS